MWATMDIDDGDDDMLGGLDLDTHVAAVAPAVVEAGDTMVRGCTWPHVVGHGVHVLHGPPLTPRSLLVLFGIHPIAHTRT